MIKYNCIYKKIFSCSGLAVDSLKAAMSFCLWNTGGGMLDKTGSQATGVGLKVPVMIHMDSCSLVSIKSECADLPQARAQYSATE